MNRITKDMIIADIIAIDPNLIATLMEAGMHCVGCPSAQGESLEQASIVHGIDPDMLVETLNKSLEAQA